MALRWPNGFLASGPLTNPKLSNPRIPMEISKKPCRLQHQQRRPGVESSNRPKAMTEHLFQVGGNYENEKGPFRVATDSIKS